MSLAILFHFLCAQHVSDINNIHHQELATILLNYLTGCIVLGEAALQPATQIPLQPNHTETPTHIEPRTR